MDTVSPTDVLLASFGALRWDEVRARQMLSTGKALWIHDRYDTLTRQGRIDPRMVRLVTVRAMTDATVRTDFGSYSLTTGRNTFTPCGCVASCDCYGRLYLLPDHR